jgi:hypothetical protein
MFPLLQSGIQTSVSELLHSGNTGELVVLKFDLREQGETFTWFDNNEIGFMGSRYDVAHYAVSGNIISFYCYNDKEEEGLYSELNQNVQQNQDSSAYTQSKTKDIHSPAKVKNQARDLFFHKRQASSAIAWNAKFSHIAYIRGLSKGYNRSLLLPPEGRA